MVELALVALSPPSRALAPAPVSPPPRPSTASLLVAQVYLLRKLAKTAAQSISSCAALASLVRTLGHVLPVYRSASDAPTRTLLREMSADLGDAVVLVGSCQSAPGIFSRSAAKEARIEAIATRIRDRLGALNLVNQAKLMKQNEQRLAAAAVAAHPRGSYCLTLTNNQVSAAIAAAVAAAPSHHPRRLNDDGRVNVQLERATGGRASGVHVRPAVGGGGGGGASGAVHVRTAVGGGGRASGAVHVRTAAGGGGRASGAVHVRTAAGGGGRGSSGVHVRVAADGRAACDVRVLHR